MASKANAPNWKKIKTDYLAGQPIKDIAQKHGVSVSAINSRRTREGWASDKANVASKARQKCIEKIADQQADFMAQIVLLHNRAGLEAFQKVLKQIQDFPESASATKITRESVKLQVAENGDGKTEKIPLRTFIESNFTDSIRSLAALSRDFGLDAASKLAREKLQNEMQNQTPEGDALPQIIITRDGGVEVHE